MVLVYRSPMPKRMYTFFTLSIILHLALILLFSTRKSIASDVFITEVSYIEENLPAPEAISPQQPQSRVGYLIPPKSMEEALTQTPGTGGGGVGGFTETSGEPVVDLSTRIDRSQAKIELERYEAEDEGALAVVRIADKTAGGMKSTEEILAEKPISLAKNLPRGPGGGGGLTIGTTSTVRQTEVPTIKIDKKPPPPKISEIGKRIEEKVEEKLRVEKAGTQILLAGPIANRGILKKILPQYPNWCLQRGISGIVKIRIWVNPSGTIREGTLIEVSSGYPDLDQAVINAIRIWQFAPLPSNVVQETQWGIITFRFVLG